MVQVGFLYLRILSIIKKLSTVENTLVQNEMWEKNPGVGFPGRFFFSTRYFERRVKALTTTTLITHTAVNAE
jgi:hypothetical protein